ncbi:1-(5-phosphoribosyl)-5-[(5-phosphoribosylamino)methylideneamino]imidazole-4-carboxamide isomerase [Flavobacterium oreochromis]|uniref:1-(5-phosphoribosyl)-5-[(5-phosphoribosylamino)methylideneamino] imidazole-4-carboxamide isomerase n=2 Tax=Flavobacterium TaxID=237 RepID=A0A246G7V4_9FLAO|nr:1-(5-phosphoribosyl)-5-[(5-phosphoribosylamino)methylideneamino]imidazole-4-carboxamide isomerase [Flavobacterium oreochromis]OWP74688.1 1-(5-phosphoribosyl)-5-[(5-phosphoribosylamino)methylideneamino]imidazole-4-carboxamide isomerase [Flavobacterium oreochromis]OWP74702.1 1-(5-phosphoribosyl)-5-[(5-phosphoribosylamino)methylideneamino]imidazole-4-carboxamide isomerase [Flavobacterium oreochromis]POR22002.1 1-(5-phosphoribosyl)-5-[(5-phosphoribosylamino)methylideneamino]imidazole-4-carboxamid
MKIIPAIDIINGKCVRLTKGDYSTQKIYNENPIEVAKKFEANGIQYLHLVDLDGAKSNHIVNYKVLEEIARKTSLKIDFGGGIKSLEDVKIAFNSGATQITGGSIAVQNPTLFLTWLENYGSEKIILGADAHNRKIVTQGWLQKTEQDVVQFIKNYVTKGITHVICTDVAKDGMLQGASNELYQEILKNTKSNLIASGGVSSIEDIIKLKQINCYGVIVGKAIYEGKINLKDLSKLC